MGRRRRGQGGSKLTRATNDDTILDLLHIPTKQNQEPLLQLQCIINTIKIIRCFKITSPRAWRMSVYVEKPYKKCI